MGTRLGLAVLIGLGLMASRPMSAVAEDEHDGHKHEQTAAATQGQDAKQHCEHCQKSAAELDTVLSKIAQAKQSNDVAQVRSLLGEVEKPLAELKGHMTMCSNQMAGAKGMCSMCHVKLDKDGRCPQCGMKM